MWKTGFHCLIGIQISTHVLSEFVFLNTRNRREYGRKENGFSLDICRKEEGTDIQN